MFDNGAWFWIWAVLAAFFYVGEIFTAAFFMMPFGVGATVAALLAYLDLNVAWQWAAFIVDLRRLGGAAAPLLGPVHTRTA